MVSGKNGIWPARFRRTKYFRRRAEPGNAKEIKSENKIQRRFQAFCPFSLAEDCDQFLK